MDERSVTNTAVEISKSFWMGKPAIYLMYDTIEDMERAFAQLLREKLTPRRDAMAESIASQIEGGIGPRND